jgi:PLP dependent protein
MTRAQTIAENLAGVRDQLAGAERAAGRAPGSVRLIAVAKKMPPDDIRAALAAGQRVFGENYAQELRDKRAALANEAPPIEWHYLGPVQTNKVKYLSGLVAMIHSVDSFAVLDAIEARAFPQPCLVQVNISAEPQKRGVAPRDLPTLLDRFATTRFARCDGLMLIPPITGRPEDARAHFASLRALRDQEAARGRPNVALDELSMGMSNDFPFAVVEGATIVRIGSAIFGPRASTRP